MKKTVKKSSPTKSIKQLVPSCIKKGDTIGLVAPAGSIINRQNLVSGINMLEEQGFKVKYNHHIIHTKGYLAGTDEERADEFNSFWADPEVKALIAARGGYGSMRMLHLIKMKQIRKNPRILIGFSDLSALITVIALKTGLVTFHGPVVTTLNSIDKKSLASFFSTLTRGLPQHIKPVALKKLQHGSAKGILLGGNLTILVHMLGTPYEIPWQETILFLEDTGESPYRLDRMLTHLYHAGRLQKIKGLILGSFSDGEKKEDARIRKTVEDRVLELLSGYNIPVWANFPVGHGRRNIILPIGIKVEMDANENMLRFL